MDCAREMRGTSSMAKLVMRASFSARTSAAWLCGARKPATAAPGFSFATRPASGGCTVKRRSAAASTASAPSAKATSLYWESGKRAAAPCAALDQDPGAGPRQAGGDVRHDCDAVLASHGLFQHADRDWHPVHPLGLAGRAAARWKIS